LRLQFHLQDTIHEASLKSTKLTCEQVASIRTIAALRREEGVSNEFSKALDISVRPALITTLKTTAVAPIDIRSLIYSYSRPLRLCLSGRM